MFLFLICVSKSIVRTYGNSARWLTCLRISHILQKRFYFPNSPYLEDLGMDLATDPEYASDKYLVHIVRLQLVSDKIALHSAPDLPGPHEINLGIEHSYDALKAELSLYQANLPFPLTENR